MLEIEQAYLSGQQSKKEANEAYKRLNREIQKSNKMTSEEKKELGRTILKLVLELLLQVITLFIPALCGKSITNLKNIIKK